MARRNGEFHTPEHLPLMLPFVDTIGFASMLLYAFTCDGKASWWGPYISWALYEFCFVAILVITTAYAAESWSQDPRPALVMVVGGKNIVSFGLSYGLIRLLTEIGYKKSICTFAAIHAFLFLLAIPVFYLAPKVRMPCLSPYSIYSPQFFHSPSLWRLRHVPNFWTTRTNLFDF